MSETPVRILLAKPGLDGHDRGIKVVARALRDAGFQVIYLGLRNTPGEIVNAAIQEDAGFIGLSILSGAHMQLTEKIINSLREQKIEDIKVVVGGTIPAPHIKQLKSMGAAAVFPTGSDFDDMIDFFKTA